MSKLYDEYKDAQLRVTEIQTILENQTDSYYEIGEDSLVKKRDELQQYINEIESITGWKW